MAPRKRQARPGRPATRRRRSAEEARREILDAAQRALAAGGPEAVRLQDVAREVGISHPAVLHHFGSRDGLLLALERRVLDALRERLAETADSGEALERAFAALADSGYARLVAWWALRGGPQLPAALASEVRSLGLLRDLAAPIQAERAARARAVGRPAPDPLEAAFVVRLATVAMFGEALLGPILSQSAGLGSDAAVRPRFRRWLARVMDRALAVE